MNTFSSGGGIDRDLLDRGAEIERRLGIQALLRGPGNPPSWVAGWCYMAAGDLEAAELALRHVLSGSEAAGVEGWRADVLLRLSAIAAQTGESHRAADLAAQGLEIAEQTDLPQLIAALLSVCGQAALNLGHAEGVRDHARRGMAAALSAGDMPYQLRNEALLGSLDLVLGNYREAANRLRPLAEQWQASGVRIFNPTSIEPEAIEALIGAGDLEAASGILAKLERQAHNTMAASVTAHGRGKLAAGRGDLSAAIRELTEALRLLDQCSPRPLEGGRILLGLGAVQRRLQQRATARANLTEALGIFESLDASLWAVRARAELARVSGRAPGSHELTVAESRVAALVARGLTNRQVAAELFVTVRAVESTLTKAYAKMGVRSRTELAARIRDPAD